LQSYLLDRIRSDGGGGGGGGGSGGGGENNQRAAKVRVLRREAQGVGWHHGIFYILVDYVDRHMFSIYLKLLCGKCHINVRVEPLWKGGVEDAAVVVGVFAACCGCIHLLLFVIVVIFFFSGKREVAEREI
jgi:hypothetical protein